MAPNSPDLNPVDYKICGIMQQRVYEMKIFTRDVSLDKENLESPPLLYYENHKTEKKLQQQNNSAALFIVYRCTIATLPSRRGPQRFRAIYS